MQEQTGRRSNRQRTEETRSALLAAARELFIEKGFSETGTPEIVKAAKVTRGALYHHFRDKEDLFRTVVSREAEAVGQEIEQQATSSGDAFAALEMGARAYFDAMATPGRVRLLLLDGPATLGPREMARIDGETGGGSLKEGLAAALLAPAANPQPGPGNLGALAELLSAAFDRAALAISEGGPRPDYEAAMTFLLTRLVTRSGTPASEQSAPNGNRG